MKLKRPFANIFNTVFDLVFVTSGNATHWLIFIIMMAEIM